MSTIEKSPPSSRNSWVPAPQQGISKWKFGHLRLSKIKAGKNLSASNSGGVSAGQSRTTWLVIIYTIRTKIQGGSCAPSCIQDVPWSQNLVRQLWQLGDSKISEVLFLRIPPYFVKDFFRRPEKNWTSKCAGSKMNSKHWKSPPQAGKFWDFWQWLRIPPYIVRGWK